MVQHKPTPEEQLLKLIEGGGKTPEPPRPGSEPQKKSPSKPAAKFSVPGIGKLLSSLSYFKTQLSKGKAPAASGVSLAVFDIRQLNRMLVVLVIAAGVYLAVSLIFSGSGQSDFLAQISTSDAVYPVSLKPEAASITEISAYQDPARKRNPFFAPQTAQTPTAANSGPAAAAPASGSLQEMLQGFKLVGISFSDQPLAMIEEPATGRTYFLRKGQEFKGLKVQEISKEKVTVTYEGQQADLF